MKNLKLYVKDWGFWVVIYAALITCAFIISLVVFYSKVEENEMAEAEYYKKKMEYLHEKQSLTRKINEYEKNIEKIGRYVDSLSDDELDAEYERLFPSK